MNQRRSVYFAFQGLLTAVLLLMYVFRYAGTGAAWLPQFCLLLAFLLVPLAAIQLVPVSTLNEWWFPTSFFIADAAAATFGVSWRQPAGSAYLLYFLIILCTAMTRSYVQSVAVGAVSCLLFLLRGWSPTHGLPQDTIFWLRFQLLIITTCLLSVLSRDAQKVQADQERRYQQRLVEAERLATLGRVAGEVAHRIKGPLTTIKVNTELLMHKYAKSVDALKQLAEIDQETEHCKVILKSLLDLGRIEETDFASLDLRSPIKLSVQAVQTQLKKKGLRLATAGLDKPVRVRGDHSLLQEALGAVLLNAIEAGREGGYIRLTLARLRPRQARVTIEDDGKGIAAADLERIFQPFFTTKAAGSGLGLSAALRILQKHDGTIDVDSEGLGQGAKFVLTLPTIS